MKFNIPPSALPYLQIQRRGISHLIGTPAWKGMFEATIEADFESIRSILPENPGNILDVGGGMSGLGVRLYHHYADQLPVIAVLDGLADPPKVEKHWKTFNDAVATAEFMRANGVHNFRMIAPYDQQFHALKFGLVVSTQAWCFHFPPALYLHRVKTQLAKDGILIVDVRRGKEWAHQLHQHFEVLGGLIHAEKWVRMAFQKRAN
jgi:hypothetical protein